MLERVEIWWGIHDMNHHLYVAWCVGFCALMLTWPILLYSAGINVFDSAWYWLTMLL